MLLSPEEKQFLALANVLGMITPAQSEEVVQNHTLLKELTIEIPLWEIFLKKNYLSPREIQKIRDSQKKGPLILTEETSQEKEIPGFEILEKIGQGSMGVVYKALQKKMDRLVALKILFIDNAAKEQAVDFFLREGRAIGKLNHPNIVQGIDAGEYHGQFFLALEYVNGMPLDKHLEEKGKFSEKETIEIAFQIAGALLHLDQHKIIHRDIKPGNIFLTTNGIPKLGDLGLAKQKDEPRLTKTNAFYGSPAYISPEQISSYSDIDIRSDIYALGVSLYEILTGHVPYEGASYMEVLHSHYSANIPSVLDLEPTLSPEIDFLIRKMTRLKKDERYQNPTELIRDIELIRKGAHLASLAKETDLQKANVLEDLYLTNEKLPDDSMTPPKKITHRINPIPSEKPPSAKTAPSIFLVEDSLDMRIFVKATLEEQGYFVITVRDGVDALVNLTFYDFDLIISNFAMPHMHGRKLLELKAKKGIDTPVIFFSVDKREDGEIQGLKMGAENFLRKPCSPEVLLAKVEEVLRQRYSSLLPSKFQ